MKIYAKVGTSEYQKGGNCPEGYIPMTQDKPITPGNWIAQEDGTWYNDFKTLLRDIVSTIRSDKEQDYFVWNGFSFDSNPESINRLIAASQSTSLERSWTLKDNTKITLTRYELGFVVGAYGEWSDSCHSHASNLKQQINNVTTEAEAQAIDIINGWPTPEDVANSSV